jgi:Glycosyl transferase family 2
MSAGAHPDVSIIITSFNYERYVGDTIRSALDQHGARAEVIVVDDGSRDGSRDVIRSFGERITPIFQENTGQASAQNVGFEASRGDAVVFLDSDDLLLPSAAASAARALADRAVAKAHWSLPIVDADGDRTGEIQDPELAEGDLRAHLFRDGPLSDLTMPSPPTSGNAYPRWFLELVMPVPERIYFKSPDEYLFGLAPAFGLIARLPPQSLYRIHGENAHLLRPFEQMLAFQLEHYDAVAPIAAEACRGEGIVADEEGWARSAWWLRTDRAVRAIEAVVPPGERFTLIDQTLLGVEAQLRGRPVVAFPEANGEWAGNPGDDEEAVGELERLRADSLRYVAVAWPSFWWFEEYPRLGAALRSMQHTLRDDPDVVIFGPAES